MGRRGTESPAGDRVLTLTTRAAGGTSSWWCAGDRLAGVTCVGAPELGTALTLAYDRGTPLPADPLSLLLPDRPRPTGPRR